MKLWSRLLVLLVSISVITGCFLMGGNNDSKDSGGVINFNIKNDFSSRTIEPDLDIVPSSYRLIGSGPNGAGFDEIVDRTEARIDYLVFGDWQVSVEVRNAAGYVFARGNGTTTVNVGQEASLAITTSMLEGQGTLDLSFTYPVDQVQNPSFTANLLDSTRNPIVLATTDAGITENIQTLTSNGTALSSGYYTLVSQVIDLGATGDQNHIAMGAVEVVRILQDQVTSGTLNLSGVMGTGSIGLSLISDFNEVIPVAIEVPEAIPNTFAFNSNTTFSISGTVPGTDEDINNVTYAWYVNGVLVDTGVNYTIDSNSSPLVQNRGGAYLPGTYRVDLIVFNVDGSRGGSDTYVFNVTGNATLVSTEDPGSIIGTVGYMATDESGSTFVPLVGATVTSGNVSTSADSMGNFVLNGITAGRGVVTISAAGYLSNSKTVAVLSNQTSDIQRVLLLPAETYTFSSSNPVSYQLNGGVGSVDFVADSFVDANGNPYSGDVTINTSAISPSLPGFFDLFPGDFTGVTVSGDIADIISYGVVTVELEDDNGNPLQLGDGSTAEISMSVQDPANAPATLPLWYFDEATGNWVEDGVATLVGDRYVGTVSHFTSWNFDWIIPQGGDERVSIATFSGQVLDENGAAVADAEVILTCLSGLAWETTVRADANGQFSSRVYVSRNDTSPVYSAFAIKDGQRSRRELIELNNYNVNNIVIELRNPLIDLTVDARRGFRTQRVENGGAFFRLGDSNGTIAINLSNEDSDGLIISDVSLTGSSQFVLTSTVATPLTLNYGSNQLLYIEFTYVQNLGSVSGELVITSNSVENPTYTIRLEGGSDLTQTLSETTSVAVSSNGTGYIFRDMNGNISPNNVWTEPGATITETATTAYRICLGFDLSSIPSNATIDSVSLNVTSGFHNGIIVYQGNQGQVLTETDFDPVNTAQLTDTLLTDGGTVSFNAAGNTAVENSVGGLFPLLLVNNDSSAGVVDLTSASLTVTYSY